MLTESKSYSNAHGFEQDASGYFGLSITGKRMFKTYD